MLNIIVLIPTDFPEPVVPAISRCGIRSKFAKILFPDISFPNARVRQSFSISNNNDDLYGKAVDIVIKQQKVSTSYIQRYLQIGYNRAARIVEKMEEDGIISEANNAGKRHVLKK